MKSFWWYFPIICLFFVAALKIQETSFLLGYLFGIFFLSFTGLFWVWMNVKDDPND